MVRIIREQRDEGEKKKLKKERWRRRRRRRRRMRIINQTNLCNIEIIMGDFKYMVLEAGVGVKNQM